MTDRRRFTDEDLTRFGAIVDRKLGERLSLKKNGHTWGQYFEKSLTPERIFHLFAWVIVLAFTFGGNIRDAKQQLADAAAKADAASAKSEAAAIKADTAAKTIDQIRLDLSNAVNTIEEQKAAQIAFRAQVKDQLSTAVTRSEFRSVVTQEILPKLERIEKAQPK